MRRAVFALAACTSTALVAPAVGPRTGVALRAERVTYYSSLTQAEKLDQLGRCRFMERSEFADGCACLAGKKVVIVGCGAQGLNQGLNMRDSGCDVSYALREVAIEQKRASFVNAQSNGFTVGTYDAGRRRRDAEDEEGRHAGVLARLQYCGRGHER